MAVTAETSAFDRSVRPIAETVFREQARAILAFQPAPEVRARIEELADKSTEGLLTEAERAEYAGYVRANKFIALLQRLARQVNGPSA
jgi:hypothetical protein